MQSSEAGMLTIVGMTAADAPVGVSVSFVPVGSVSEPGRCANTIHPLRKSDTDHTTASSCVDKVAAIVVGAPRESSR